MKKERKTKGVRKEIKGTGKGIGERVVEATPDAVKTRIAKAKEVFNPLKGEFGLSELITGR